MKQSIQNNILQRIAELNRKDDLFRSMMKGADTDAMMRYIALCSQIQQEIGYLYTLLSDVIDDRKETNDRFRTAMDIIIESVNIVDRLLNNVNKGAIPEQIYEDAYQLVQDYKVKKK